MTTLPLDAIQPNPDQPRRHFDEAALGELADSIRAVGLLEPIIVRGIASAKNIPGHYEIIAGERRWRAAKIVGLDRVPAIIREDVDEAAAFELSLIENVIREDMNPIEEAEGFAQLLSRGLDIDTMASRTGKAAGAIRSRLALLRLDPAIRDLVRVGQMDAYDAGHLSRLSIEGQFTVVRAMNAGALTKPADLQRMVGVIHSQEAQVDMFAEGEVETLAPATVKAQRDLGDELGKALAAISRVHELIDAGALRGTDPTGIALMGEAIAKGARQIAQRADIARLEDTARQLTTEAA